jgi:hypothetical protein
MQELFSSPLDHEGKFTESIFFPSETPIMNQNYIYQPPSKLNIHELQLWKFITQVTGCHPRSTFNGYKASLCVTLPRSPDHPFWKSSNAEYTWNYKSNIPTTTFTVEKWGTTALEAITNTTQRAKQIISLIRESIPLQDSQTNFNAIQDKSIDLGMELHELWKEAYVSFTELHSVGFWNFAIERLRSLTTKFPHLEVLLKYYEVFCSPFFFQGLRSRLFCL